MFLFLIPEVLLKFERSRMEKVRRLGKSLFENGFFSGPFLIIIAASLWALDGITRRSLYHLAPIIIVFFEHLIGSLILLPFLPKILKNQKFTLSVWIVGFMVALFGGLLGTLWITTALASVNYISFSVVFLLQKLQPLFTIVSAHFLLGEKISAKYLKWAVLALIAAFFVTFPNGMINFATGNGTIVAAMYSVGAAAVWGLGTTFSKMLLNRISDHASIVVRYYGATLLAFVAVFFFGQQHNFTSVGMLDVGRLIFIAFTTGLAAMLLYYRGLKNTPARISTILELTMPLLAIFVDMFLYKTFLAPAQYIAAIVLLFVMFKVSKLQHEKVEDSPAQKLPAASQTA